jgi:DNA polymerase III subunit delta'
VLQPLEEPPPRGVIFLVSHAPGRLLSTIRSRCRRLLFRPLGLEATAAFVREHTSANPEEALRLARMSGEAPGRALSLAAGSALALDDAAREILLRLPDLDEAATLALTDRFRGGEGAANFSLLLERLAERVHEMARERASARIGGLDPWAQAWERLTALPREVEALNLDRADALFTALRDLRIAARA